MSERDLHILAGTHEGLVSRRQALEHLSDDALRHRLATRWQIVLPGVYATFTGALSEHQRQHAAVLYVGTGAQLSDTTALRHYGLRYLPDDAYTRVLIDWERRRQSTSYVQVRRTRYLEPPWGFRGLPFASPARALVDFAVRERNERVIQAVLSDAVQRRVVTLTALERAVEKAPRPGSARLLRALEVLRAGTRSAPEARFREIALRSNVPTPLFNALIELPNRRRVSPDALVEEAGLVHETNGRSIHGDEDDFESMQERHDVMTAAGLVVLHNAPRRLFQHGDLVQEEWECCYARYAGRGLPPGVRILRRSAG